MQGRLEIDGGTGRRKAEAHDGLVPVANRHDDRTGRHVATLLALDPPDVVGAETVSSREDPWS
ncbi:hypothetical protein AB0F91_17375 [Amycolatopsis sp. NPDC023774]|uniref:hypothetical protein n=1 Tax=Amycolatopsis sp. NPDC023774 TaxID=3155015 RepID=UPI0033FEF8D5